MTAVKSKKGTPNVKVGDVLIYKKGHGPTHHEWIMDNDEGAIVETWTMEAIGPCWIVGTKVVRTKDY